MNKEHAEKMSLLTELIKLARVDDEIKEIEFQFLFAISKQLGIAPSDFEKAFHTYYEFTPPPLEFDRILQFQRLVLLMNIDFDLDPAQLAMVRDMGIKMGLNPLATNEVLKIMHTFPNNMVPADQLIQLFRHHHN